MTLPLRSLLLITGLAFAGIAQAAIYRDIGPLDTLGDTKKRFPSAKFEKLAPAWAQEDDIMYKITGFGLSGTIVVKFHDERPRWRKQAEETTDQDTKKMFAAFANDSDDSVQVQWVRWIPIDPIPLQRFLAKYGPPEGKGFADEDLQPFREWTSQGLSAYLTDDEKAVVRVDFNFTTDEECGAWKAKTGSVPAFLQGRCIASTQKAPHTNAKNH